MNTKIIWVLRILAAVIMLQTLFFKFTAAPESVFIFSLIHAEPFGRIATGCFELLAAVLLLLPKTSWFGAILGIGLMLGAIATHVGFIGLVVLNDGGKLFSLAITTLCCCMALFFNEKEKIKAVFRKFGILL